MIVVGGSLGGCDALCEILRRLPPSFSVPIAVVLHRHRESQGMLQPEVQRASALPVREVEDKDEIRPGHVYLCPPDYHLLIDNGCFSLSLDDPVNFARPSIDALFESAAEWKGPALTAVVLSGAGSDGTRGALEIKRRGGLILVQDPKTAEGPWMPTAALVATRTPHILTLAQIAEKLIEISAARK